MVNDLIELDIIIDEDNEELHRLFKDLFICPLCRNNTVQIIRAYYDECPFGVFELSCEKCNGSIEYYVSDEIPTIKKTREKLLKLHKTALKSLHQKNLFNIQ